MSILDGLPRSEEDVKAASDVAIALIDAHIVQECLDPSMREILALMRQGVTLKSILRLTSEDCDALFSQACRDFEFGEIRRAREVLLMLHMLNPLEGRHVYVLAATYQTAGDYATAGKLYVQFLARDATNPDGYLRLGECFFANREYDMAADTFRMALECAEDGADPTAVSNLASRLIMLSQQQIDVANDRSQ